MYDAHTGVKFLCGGGGGGGMMTGCLLRGEQDRGEQDRREVGSLKQINC